VDMIFSLAQPQSKVHSALSFVLLYFPPDGGFSQLFFPHFISHLSDTESTSFLDDFFFGRSFPFSQAALPSPSHLRAKYTVFSLLGGGPPQRFFVLIPPADDSFRPS